MVRRWSSGNSGCVDHADCCRLSSRPRTPRAFRPSSMYLLPTRGLAIKYANCACRLRERLRRLFSKVWLMLVARTDVLLCTDMLDHLQPENVRDSNSPIDVRLQPDHILHYRSHQADKGRQVRGSEGNRRVPQPEGGRIQEVRGRGKIPLGDGNGFAYGMKNQSR